MSVPNDTQGAPFLVVVRDDRWFVSISGQSNSNPGSGGSPALSTSQPYDQLRRSGTTAVACVETSVESLASGCANWFGFNETDRKIIVDGWGVGATPYSGLAYGTVPFTTGQTGVRNARAAIIALRPVEAFRLAGLVWIHGESDEIADVSAATYRGFMEALQVDFQRESRASLGVGFADAVAPLFLTQPATCGVSKRVYPNINVGMIAAVNNSNGAIVFVGPCYPLGHNASDLHLTNLGHRRNGEYAAKAIYRRQVLGDLTWQGLRPISAVSSGNTIDVTFAGGDGTPLVIDTTNVAAKPNRGFEYADSQADTPSITGVSVVSDRVVRLTLSRNADASGEVRTADFMPSLASAGPTSTLGLGTNIRDQDPTPSRDGGSPLWNWCGTAVVTLTSHTGGNSAAQAFANTQSVDIPTGASDLISWKDLPRLDGASAVTWMFWMRTNAALSNDRIVMSRSSTNDRQFDFRTRSSGVLRVAVNASLASVAEQIDYPGLVAQQWQHWAITYGAGVVVAYLNGAPVTPSAVAGTPGLTLTSGARQDVVLGGGAGTGGANLNLAHVAIWTDRTLSALEVAAAYNGGVPMDLRSLPFAIPTDYLMLQGNYENVGRGTNKRTPLPYGATAFEAIAP